MPYYLEICVAGRTMEISKYYTYRYHAKGMPRGKKIDKTSEAQKKVNQRKAEKELRRIMNTNFQDGDLLVRLDFHNRPAGSAEMQDIISDAIKKMRENLRKKKIQFKYVYVKEVGPRGGRHIHMLISKIDTDIIRKAWPHGGIHIDPLYTIGKYGQIAAYFIKYAARTEETEGRLIGKRWYHSLNMEKPKIIKKIISANEFRKEPKKVEGYELDKNSERSWISEFTGYEHYTCTLMRIKNKTERKRERKRE